MKTVLNLVVLAILGASSLFVAPVASAVPATTIPEPISIYKFDESTGATTISDSIRGAAGTGTLFGNPTFEAGKVGKALCLNGSSQYATAPLVGNGLSEFTISAWVKLDALTQWATVAKNWGDSQAGAFHLGLDDNNKYWSNYIGTTVDSGLVTSQSAGQAVLNEWQYLVTTVSQSAGQAVLYLNGTKVSAPDNMSGTILNYKTLMSFGAKLDDAQTGVASVNSGWLDGCLDEITFWDVALTKAEIDAIIDGGGGVPLPYTVTYDPNGATSGSVPNETSAQGAQIVSGNSGGLEKTGHTFAGWNTQADGRGTTYIANTSITPQGDVTLYAIWAPVLAATGSIHLISDLFAPVAATLLIGLVSILRGRRLVHDSQSA